MKKQSFPVEISISFARLSSSYYVAKLFSAALPVPYDRLYLLSVLEGAFGSENCSFAYLENLEDRSGALVHGAPCITDLVDSVCSFDLNPISMCVELQDGQLHDVEFRLFYDSKLRDGDVICCNTRYIRLRGTVTLKSESNEEEE